VGFPLSAYACRSNQTNGLYCCNHQLCPPPLQIPQRFFFSASHSFFFSSPPQFFFSRGATTRRQQGFERASGLTSDALRSPLSVPAVLVPITYSSERRWLCEWQWYFLGIGHKKVARNLMIGSDKTVKRIISLFKLHGDVWPPGKGPAARGMSRPWTRPG